MAEGIGSGPEAWEWVWFPLTWLQLGCDGEGHHPLKSGLALFFVYVGRTFWTGTQRAGRR